MTRKYKVQIFECKMVKCGEQSYVCNKVDCFEQACKIINYMLKDSPCERMVVVYLNGQNKLIGTEQVSQGGLAGAAVLPRDILRGAIAMNASAIIIGHNHPSGDPTPSYEDQVFTSKVAEACDIIGIPLVDHVIVTANGESRSVLE